MEKPPALITLKVEKGRKQHLPAGYDICHKTRHEKTTMPTTCAPHEHTGSRPCRWQCIRPRAFPNLALVHTAEGIPQPSTLEVICVPGPPRTRQGYRLNYCGYTKTMSKIPHIEHTDYTKDDSRATALTLYHLGLHQGQFQGYRRK